MTRLMRWNFQGSAYMMDILKLLRTLAGRAVRTSLLVVVFAIMGMGLEVFTTVSPLFSAVPLSLLQ